MQNAESRKIAKLSHITAEQLRKFALAAGEFIKVSEPPGENISSIINA